jgi:two-component system phosphate regulon response regulator OmpR
MIVEIHERKTREMSAKEHIVVVDDELDVRETIQEYLVLQGYRVTAVNDGKALRQLVEAEEAFDLAILDITMPGEDGLSLARFLREHSVREHSEVGIIMVTASGETVDRIVGLEMGADDYLPKPVDFRELLARVKAVLRRRGAAGRGPAANASERQLIAFGRCQLDLEAHELFDEDGAKVPLTAMEYDLLKAFGERPNRVLSRDQLLELAHNRDWEPFDRSIDIRIARIRRKVERDPGKPQVIKTVRGAGYIFSPGS